MRNYWSNILYGSYVCRLFYRYGNYFCILRAFSIMEQGFLKRKTFLATLRNHCHNHCWYIVAWHILASIKQAKQIKTFCIQYVKTPVALATGVSLSISLSINYCISFYLKISLPNYQYKVMRWLLQYHHLQQQLQLGERLWYGSHLQRISLPF